MLRVKNGPCAPLRLSSMLSRPATGTTCMPVIRGDLPPGLTPSLLIGLPLSTRLWPPGAVATIPRPLPG